MIERIVRVLDTFATDRTTQTATQISRRAGLPHSTAHRLVNDLVDTGLLERNEDNEVHLGMRLWELALRGSKALRLRQAALPHMEQVQRRIRQHTQLAVLEQDAALFIERLSHPDAGANITLVAGRLPLHASSSGLVLLAHADPAIRQRVLEAALPKVGPNTITDPHVLEHALRDIRAQGYVIAPGTVQGVSTGVAVPIRDAGVVAAAVSVILPRGTDPQAALHALREAALLIETDLTESRGQ